jgi:hypothetical protein
MPTVYRIKYKFIESGKTYSGTRIVDDPIDIYLKHIYKTYPEADLIYIELIEEMQVKDESASSCIILCLNDEQAKTVLP